jgi:hypothetical protein
MRGRHASFAVSTLPSHGKLPYNKLSLSVRDTQSETKIVVTGRLKPRLIIHVTQLMVQQGILRDHMEITIIVQDARLQ